MKDVPGSQLGSSLLHERWYWVLKRAGKACGNVVVRCLTHAAILATLARAGDILGSRVLNIPEMKHG